MTKSTTPKAKTTIEILKPGETAILVPVLMIGELNPKWWQIWRPFIYHEATQSELKEILDA